MDRVEAIKALKNGGASLDLKDKNGMTPFLSAVFTGNKASAALLMELGTDFAACDNRLRSCIHAAVENEDITMLNLLLQETGSELLNTRDIRGRTPLHYAALSRKHEVLFVTTFTIHMNFLVILIYHQIISIVVIINTNIIITILFFAFIVINKIISS